MIGVKAGEEAAAKASLSDANVLIVLWLSNQGSGKVLAMTNYDWVAGRIAKSKPSWARNQPGWWGNNNMVVFNSSEADPDRVAVMLAGTLPEIEKWETR